MKKPFIFKPLNFWIYKIKMKLVFESLNEIFDRSSENQIRRIFKIFKIEHPGASFSSFIDYIRSNPKWMKNELPSDDTHVLSDFIMNNKSIGKGFNPLYSI
jgi:hypothetical protein